MDAGGTTPGMEEVDGVGNRPSRAMQGAIAEDWGKGKRQGAPHAMFGLAGRQLRPWALLLLTVLFAGAAQAFWFGIPTGYYTPQTYYKYGAVYSRTVVPGPNNKPVYVVYNAQGQEIAEIGETNTEPLTSARVLAGDYYRALLTQWQQVREQYELTDQDLMARDAFLAATFKTVDGKSITTPSLRADTLWVAVRPEAQRYYTDPAQLVLLELPINPAVSISDETRSLLLGKDGTLLYQTPENIGFRVAFYGTQDDPLGTDGRQYNDTIYGPLRGVYLSLGMAYTGAAITDEQGKYSMTYMLPPCPGFTFSYTTNVYLDLYYKRFNPRGSPNFPYYLMRPGYDFCNGLGVYSLAAAAIVATSATPVTRATDFPIDLMVLAGRAYVADAAGNAIPIGDATRYDGSRKALERAKQDQYDLDGDGQRDTTELGHIVTPADGSAPYFVKQDQAPEVQGVWLSSVHDVGAIGTDLSDGQTTTLPDLTRLPDWSADFDDRALLSSLSAEDLRDTDLYVFRESDGSLLIERRGLQERETSFVGADAGTGRFFYTLQLLGRGEFGYARSATEYAQFQQAVGLLDPAQYQRQADHLRAGELVRIIAINRPSGYMGSISMPLQAAGAGADPTEISFPIDELIMRPPNLKIWAERQSKVEAGLTQGETREQAIGNEGAGLADDVMISIYTEWLDADGRPLPEALGEYGYTGRLAKVVAANQLAPVTGSFSECDPACDGNQLSQFAIRPGRQLQVVRLPEQVLGKEHLYVQVSGTPSSRNPDFGSGGQSGVLTYRPTKFVPVQVPVYDEENTNLGLQAYNGLRTADPNRDLTRPAPFYRFVYRPEFQFSLYDLTVNEIRREDVEGQTTDVLPLTQPVLTSADQLVELYYDLLGPALGNEPLPPLAPYSYEGERELVFALGEQELRATVGADGTLRFDNLEHLSLLNPEDYLTIRLYSNNDAGNVLWEWAFEYLAIDTLKDVEDQLDENGTIYISADDTELPLQAILAGYADRDPSKKEPKRLAWISEGSGTLVPTVTVDDDLGIFNTTLMMPTAAGSSTTIRTQLTSDTGEASATFGRVEVVPGKPSQIDIQTEGEMSVAGLGQMTVNITVKDSHGNLVSDGTPAVLAIDGDARIESQDFYTVGGRLQAVLKGGESASAENILRVRAGDVENQTTFPVHPLNIALEGFSLQQAAGATNEVTIRLTDHQGQAVSQFPVTFRSTSGLFKGENILTGADGRARATLLNPPFATSANLVITASVGTTLVQGYQVVEVTPPSLGLRDTLLVGDVAEGSSYVYEGMSGTTEVVPYPTGSSISLKGSPGESTTLTLGSLDAPNRAPRAAYQMQEVQNGLVLDYTGLHSAQAVGTAAVNDSPNGVTRSLSFTRDTREVDESQKQHSYLQVTDASGLAAADGFGFRLDIRPFQVGGEVLTLAEGAVRVTYTDSGAFRFAVTTEQGSYSVTSPPAMTGIWHTLAGRFAGGRLELQLDSTQSVQETVAGTIQFSATPVLTVGRAFTGHMTNLKFFNWNDAPLVAFDGGGDTKTVVLDSAGRGSVVLKSLSQLHSNLANNRLATTSVALHGLGETGHVSVVSGAFYRQVSNILLARAEPLQQAAADKNLWAATTDRVLNVLVPPAHAEGGFFAAAWGLVNWIIPFDAFGTVIEQLSLIGQPGFDPTTLALASIEAASVIPIPPTKALKLVVKPLRLLVDFARPLNNKFIRHFGGVVGRMMQRVWRNKSIDPLFEVLPFLIIAGEMAGEMYQDPEMLEALKLIIASVSSEEDLMVWVDYLRLPANGWDGGPNDIPRVEDPEPLPDDDYTIEWNSEYGLSAGLQPASMHRYAGRALDFLVPRAEAAVVSKALRATKQQLKPLFKAMKEFNERWMRGNGGDQAGAARELVDGIKRIVEAMKGTDWADIRKTVFDKRTFGLAVNRASKAAFFKLYRRARNLRMSPFAIAAIITYLESRRGCSVDCKPLAEGVDAALNTLYAKAFSGELMNPDNDFIYGNKENGFFFHLAVLAYYQLSYEFLNNTAHQPIDLERTLKINLFRKNGGVYEVFGDPNKPYIRYADIVLQGENGNVLIETKSYKHPYNASYYTVWDLGRGKALRDEEGNDKKNHRQFFLDRVAIAERGDAKRLAVDFKWWFQGFKRATIEGYDSSDVQKALEKMKLLAKTSPQRIASNSLGVDSGNPTMGLTAKVDVFTVKTVLLDQFKTHLFEGLADELYQKLIENETHDLTTP